MKQCLFCKNPADSKEHVIPQWIYRRISPETDGKIPVLVARYQESHGYTEKRHQVSSRVETRIVCDSCNTGWMCQLESKVDQILSPLTEKAFPKLVHSHLEQLRAHGPLLAHWMTKTAITVAHFLPRKRQLAPQLSRIAADIAKGGVSKGIWLDVAKARVSGIGAALCDVFEIQIENAKPECRIAPYLQFQFCLQINQLLLRVGLTPGAFVGNKSPNGELPFRLFPKPDPEVPENVEYGDLNCLIHSVQLRTWPGCEGEVPGAILIPETLENPVS